MKILAIDTSSELCSAALYDDGAVLAEDVNAGQRHSQLLLPMIDRLLAASGSTLRALDAVAFGAGPGSFTGLRIACGVAQGLAYGAELPVIPIGTLAALAQASGSERAACCLDARMRQVYFGAYRRDPAGGWAEIVAPLVAAPEAVPTLPAGDWTACGAGFAVYGERLRSRLGEALIATAAVSLPHAREIATLAAFELARGAIRPADEALPVYVRDKVALTVDERR